MSLKTQGGFAVLLNAVIIMLGIAITAIVGVQSMRFGQIEQNNDYHQRLAFQAAEAGLDYAKVHLDNNATAIKATVNGSGFVTGYSNASTTNVAFTNGTTYSVTYSNPVASDFTLMQITSTGTADGGSATRTITQQFKLMPYVASAPPAGIVSKGNVTLGGNVSIANTVTGKTIWSGGNVSLSGSAGTVGAGGVTSSRSGLNSDVIDNDAGLSSLTNDAFFSGFFGASKATTQANANVTYTNNADTNYSALLNGVTGKTIWINQTGGEARLSGNATIGSPTAPVVLIVNGPFKANGTTTIYGMVYVIGTWDNSGGGNLTVDGSIVIEGSMSATGTPDVTYLTNTVSSLNTLGVYVKVPGSWKDF